MRGSVGYVTLMVLNPVLIILFQFHNSSAQNVHESRPVVNINSFKPQQGPQNLSHSPSRNPSSVVCEDGDVSCPL